MSLENVATPRLMSEVKWGVQGQVELPLGQRHLSSCNLPVRAGFAEPLPLAVHHSDGEDALASARAADAAYRALASAKERRVAECRERLRKRLVGRREKVREERQNETVQLQRAEEVLMRGVDATGRSIASAPTRQVGREELNKENTVVESPSVRVHRVRESRRAYSVVERERARERKRQCQEREAWAALKNPAENDRQIAEALVNEAMRKMQLASPEKKSDCRLHETVQRSKRIMTQSDRMIKRLRHKISTMQPKPPSLCACDDELLKTGPEHCANNCAFFGDSKSYAAALSSLVACYE